MGRAGNTLRRIQKGHSKFSGSVPSSHCPVPGGQPESTFQNINSGCVTMGSKPSAAPHCATAHTPSLAQTLHPGRVHPPSFLDPPLHRLQLLRPSLSPILCGGSAHRALLLPPRGLCSSVPAPLGCSSSMCFLVNFYLVLGSCLLQEAFSDSLPSTAHGPLGYSARSLPSFARTVSCSRWRLCKQGQGPCWIPLWGPSLQPAAQGSAAHSLNEREARR